MQDLSPCCNWCENDSVALMSEVVILERKPPHASKEVKVYRVLCEDCIQDHMVMEDVVK